MDTQYFKASERTEDQDTYSSLTACLCSGRSLTRQSCFVFEMGICSEMYGILLKIKGDFLLEASLNIHLVSWNYRLINVSFTSYDNGIRVGDIEIESFA